MAAGGMLRTVLQLQRTARTARAALTAPAGSHAAAMAAFIHTNSSSSSSMGATTTSSTTTVMPGSSIGGLNSTNATQFLMDEGDLEEVGLFSEMKLWLLTFVFTAAPLIAVLMSIVGVRYLWRKFQEDMMDEEFDEMLRRADTLNFSSSQTRQSMSAEQIQLKESDSKYTVEALDMDDCSSGSPLTNHKASGPPGLGPGLGVPVQAPLEGHQGVQTQPRILYNTMSARASNGSIITMTMHNNHLIVEREDLVGPDTEIPEDPQQQKAIVHSPPSAPTPAATTGLSQPDLSGSSDGSNNPPYAYGNQVGYDAGPMGYQLYSGYKLDEPPARLVTRAEAPALFHQPSVDVDEVPPIPDLPEDSPTGTGRLLSDVQAEQEAMSHTAQQAQQAQLQVAVNGNSETDCAEEDDDETTSATEDEVSSVKAQSPLQHQRSSPAPLHIKPVSLAAGELPLRSPVVDKLRLEDAAGAVAAVAAEERFPVPSSSTSSSTAPAPSDA